MTERLKQAIQLIKEGKHRPARDLLLEEVKADPKNFTAWLWALEVAANEKEKRLILHKILEIDPSHKGARAYLEKLDQGRSSTDTIDQDHQLGSASSKSGLRPSGLIGLVFDWAASLPSGCIFIALFIGIVASLLIYTRVNTSLFGLTGANFDKLVISNSYELISSEEIYWEVQFEGIGESKFIGIVRYVAPIRIKEFSILTHDILVTTGDFADPDVVSTNVIDHKFFWKSPNKISPSGSINLIHALPANKSIYQELLEIQKWDTVKITGREIYTINTFQSDETFLGTWQDAGCNTLLVESVTIVKGTADN